MLYYIYSISSSNRLCNVMVCSVYTTFYCHSVISSSDVIFNCTSTSHFLYSTSVSPVESRFLTDDVAVNEVLDEQRRSFTLHGTGFKSDDVTSRCFCKGDVTNADIACSRPVGVLGDD